MIKLENVTKVYKGDHVALRDATLGIDKGEFVFLVGASGSGKSTFIRLLNREEVPEHGTIYVAGKDIGTLGRWKVPYLRRNIGYIFQDFKLLPNKTVAENVAFALEVIGKPRHVIKKQVPAILELVGLSEKMSNFPSELSGGEQQRVAVARALASKPSFVLADEPTANLDSVTANNLLDLMEQLNKEQKMTFIFSTHDARVIKRAHRVVTLRDGAIESDVVKNGTLTNSE